MQLSCGLLFYNNQLYVKMYEKKGTDIIFHYNMDKKQTKKYSISREKKRINFIIANNRPAYICYDYTVNEMKICYLDEINFVDTIDAKVYNQ